MRWVTTTVVLENLRSSNEAAWKQFVGRFRGPIVRFARDLGLGPEEAEDVAQETLLDFVRAYREGQYDREKGRLSAWLFGIAHRRVLDAGRKMARRPRALGTDRQTAFWENLPDEQAARRSWDQSWQQAVLQQCVDQIRTEMQPKTIRAFELFAVEQRPAAEVARELGMSRNAVFIAKHRVLKRVLELTRQFESVS
ncbi:MAG: sigma-70 family RNA polymerase sigma factor [Phycisphaerales bacterium]|nr:MAG: sigma-70 family RNA polymerase sigma factor [Phycisphaerales bacterium]